VSRTIDRIRAVPPRPSDRRAEGVRRGLATRTGPQHRHRRVRGRRTAADRVDQLDVVGCPRVDGPGDRCAAWPRTGGRRAPEVAADEFAASQVRRMSARSTEERRPMDTSAVVE
jgi:hypothetical protein